MTGKFLNALLLNLKKKLHTYEYHTKEIPKKNIIVKRFSKYFDKNLSPIDTKTSKENGNK
jgi:hypothetical protein